ncbi:MAG: hypothetical protein KJ566_01070, partial [Nanoarchaeota archaeon]|nr:hypothetical protein [Nanoarchaeota archaeon]
ISNKNQIDQQNKLLKQVLLWLGFIIFLVLVFTLISYLRTNFKYDNVEFEVVKDSGGIIFFKTSLPVVSDGKNLNYNFYLRNDPKDLKNVRFEGKLDIKEFMVMNYTNEFSCEGYGAIAIANMNSLYNLIGTKVMKDDNATCDEQGRYIFLKILSGEKTKVEQFGPACYNLYVKDCEILEATERFMLETFVKIASEKESTSEEKDMSISEKKQLCIELCAGNSINIPIIKNECSLNCNDIYYYGGEEELDKYIFNLEV